MNGLRRATSEDLAALVALQQAAFARNRDILGVEPLPLLADYAAVILKYEAWLADGPSGLDGALILEPRPDDLLIWSIATQPTLQGQGTGRRLLAAAESRAAALGKNTLRLYTGDKLTGNIAWYQHHGYAIERTEQLPDRAIVHMVKKI